MSYECNTGGCYMSGGMASGMSGFSGYSPLERSVSIYQASPSCSSCDYSISNSELERTVDESPSILSEPVMSMYIKQEDKYGNNLYLTNTNMTSTYQQPVFLNPARTPTRFVGEAAEIEENVRETFRFVTGTELPDNIELRLCDRDELKQTHQSVGGSWTEGIAGFAINRHRMGEKSSIFIKKDELAKVMITIGHEIGHVLSAPLQSEHDEEAKAFAFEMAWAKVLHEENIAGLENAVRPDLPAQNGLHNVAFNFIQKLVNDGVKAMDAFFGLMNGQLSIGDVDQ